MNKNDTLFWIDEHPLDGLDLPTIREATIMSKGPKVISVSRGPNTQRRFHIVDGKIISPGFTRLGSDEWLFLTEDAAVAAYRAYAAGAVKTAQRSVEHAKARLAWAETWRGAK